MELAVTNLMDKHIWEDKGYNLPAYDIECMRKTTKASPNWIHFGGGNIFRAFQSKIAQELLNKGVSQTGVIVAEGYDYEILDRIYKPWDQFGVLVSFKNGGSVDKTIVASVAESLSLDFGRPSDMKRLREIFRRDSLQMASFTITEKGYRLTSDREKVLPEIETDMVNGPRRAVSYLGKISLLVYERFLAGGKPLALVSMDNCAHNGSRLREAVRGFAAAWESRGLAKQGFTAYIDDPAKISFPWTMIDKITPRPDNNVKALLASDGISGLEILVTQKGTYIAPFANAEESAYLVIEDHFPNGRPRLEAGGVILTDRETVEKAERMKVSTCLNPLHTALAVFGCLMGFDRISKEMRHPVLRRLVETIGYKEGLPVVTDPGIINPRKFIDEVIQVRIPNPFMPDSPQRIAADTSQKLGVRFGETVKSYIRSKKMDVHSLLGIPLVYAGWLRYLMGIDDYGRRFRPSPDPLLSMLTPMLENIVLGEETEVHSKVCRILSNDQIFGVDLYEAGLGEKVETFFGEMLQGPGAVERTLDKYI